MWPRQEVANRPSRCWGRGRGPQDGRRECQLWGGRRAGAAPSAQKGGAEYQSPGSPSGGATLALEFDLVPL